MSEEKSKTPLQMLKENKTVVKCMHFVEDKTEEIKDLITGENANKVDVMKLGAEKKPVEVEIVPEEISAATVAALCGR